VDWAVSKFAAIEARATQSPASTNDVVWLLERVRQLRTAVELLQDHAPDCEAGNRLATAALAALKEPNLS